MILLTKVLYLFIYTVYYWQ